MDWLLFRYADWWQWPMDGLTTLNFIILKQLSKDKSEIIWMKNVVAKLILCLGCRYRGNGG